MYRACTYLESLYRVKNRVGIAYLDFPAGEKINGTTVDRSIGLHPRGMPVMLLGIFRLKHLSEQSSNNTYDFTLSTTPSAPNKIKAQG